MLQSKILNGYITLRAVSGQTNAIKVIGKPVSQKINSISLTAALLRDKTILITNNRLIKTVTEFKWYVSFFGSTYFLFKKLLDVLVGLTFINIMRKRGRENRTKFSGASCVSHWEYLNKVRLEMQAICTQTY